MIRIDTHIHTSRYSDCAEFLHPQALASWALLKALDAVVITEHDVLWTAEEIGQLQSSISGLQLFRGIECSTDLAHLVLIGMEDSTQLHRGCSFQFACNQARRQGAAVILAHPFRDADPNLAPIELVDAIEIISTSISPEETILSRRLAQRYQKPMISCSDAHALSKVGWSWTEFPRMPRDETDLSAMIRQGQGVPRLSLEPSP